MTRDDFLNLPEWQKISDHIFKLVNEVIEEIDLAKDYPKVRELVGHKMALLSVLRMPEQLLFDSKAEAKRPEAVVELPNHPKSGRSYS